MSDTEIDLKREEDERLDTAEDPNEEVRTITITCLRTRKAAQTRHLYITPSSPSHCITIHCNTWR
jgi:hypothetical protein